MAARGEAVTASDALADPMGLVTRHRLPNREMRRQAFPHEVTAAVDYAVIEATFDEAADTLDGLFLTSWLPEQATAISDAIVYTRRGTARVRLTAADMARVQAPVVGINALVDVLYDVAARGAAEAVAELGAQGLDLSVPSEAVLRGLVRDHATAVAQMLADGLSMASARQAVRLVGSGITPTALAVEVVDYLTGLEHVYERNILAGAVAQATGAGRLHVFEQTDQAATSFYISSMLDDRVCAPCLADDGREFVTAAEMRAQMPAGGNKDCLGRDRCRCIGIAVHAED